MLVLGCAVGAIAALPFARWARHETVVTRVRPLRSGGSTIRSRGAGRGLPPFVAAIVRVAAGLRARRVQRRRDASLRRELPVVVDLVAVALAAGCTPFLALEHACRYGPALASGRLRGVVDACALGQSLDAALRELGTREPVLRRLVDALRTSARLGSPAAPALARLATEVRADLRRRAEARARTVPVRLCFPLVACVLPAFALLTVAPVVLGGMHT